MFTLLFSPTTLLDLDVFFVVEFIFAFDVRIGTRTVLEVLEIDNRVWRMSFRATG